MSEILTEFPGRRVRRGTYRTFLDGRIHRVRGGVDVAAGERAAVNNFYITAARMGLRARVHVESRDPLVLVVQALPKA